MSGNQTTRLSKGSRAKEAHEKIVESFPLYKETAHWHPVICKVSKGDAIARRAWADNRGLLRGDTQARNDYLVPLDGLWIFKDPKIAMEFKLLWG